MLTFGIYSRKETLMSGGNQKSKNIKKENTFEWTEKQE